MPVQHKQARNQEAQRAKLVEEFALLDKQIGEWKPYVLRHEKIRQLILGWYDHVSGEEEILVPGTSKEILISARDKMRSVTPQGKQKLFQLWGAKNFLARCTVLLKFLPDPEDQKKQYTTAAFTGPRHLHVRPKSAG